jgi:hypothetical protein
MMIAAPAYLIMDLAQFAVALKGDVLHVAHLEVDLEHLHSDTSWSECRAAVSRAPVQPHAKKTEEVPYDKGLLLIAHHFGVGDLDMHGHRRSWL